MAIVGDLNSDITIYEIIKNKQKLVTINLQIGKIHSILIQNNKVYAGGDKNIGMIDLKKFKEINHNLKGLRLEGEIINGMYLGKLQNKKQYLFIGCNWDSSLIAYDLAGINSNS